MRSVRKLYKEMDKLSAIINKFDNDYRGDDYYFTHAKLKELFDGLNDRVNPIEHMIARSAWRLVKTYENNTTGE